MASPLKTLTITKLLDSRKYTETVASGPSYYQAKLYVSFYMHRTLYLYYWTAVCNKN